MRDKDGNLQTDPDSISEAFAQFYEALYKELESHADRVDIPSPSRADRITADEVKAALGTLKNRRTGADDGLVAEMLKTGHQGLIETLTVFFYDDILQGFLQPPDSWRTSKLKLIFKKGDPELPKKNSPISIIPVLARCTTRSYT